MITKNSVPTSYSNSKTKCNNTLIHLQIDPLILQINNEMLHLFCSLVTRNLRLPNGWDIWINISTNYQKIQHIYLLYGRDRKSVFITTWNYFSLTWFSFPYMEIKMAGFENEPIENGAVKIQTLTPWPE